MNDDELLLITERAIRRWLRRLGLPGAIVALVLLLHVELPLAQKLAMAEIRQTVAGILTNAKHAEKQWQASQRVQRK